MESFLSFHGSILPSRSARIRTVCLDFTMSSSKDRPIYPTRPLDFAHTRSRHAVRNQLPIIPWKEKPTFWTAACKVLEGMQHLHALRMIVEPKEFSSPQIEWHLDAQVLRGLEPLKGKRVDIDVKILGQIQRIWRWRWRDKEVRYETIQGAVVWRRKVSVGESWCVSQSV